MSIKTTKSRRKNSMPFKNLKSPKRNKHFTKQIFLLATRKCKNSIALHL